MIKPLPSSTLTKPRSPFAPTSDKGQILRSKVDLASLVFGFSLLATFIVGYATQVQAKAKEAAARSAPVRLDEVDSERVLSDEARIWQILTLYAEDNNGRLPSFDSKRLPRWWLHYTREPVFDYRYVVKPEFVNARVGSISVSPRAVLRVYAKSGQNSPGALVLRHLES